MVDNNLLAYIYVIRWIHLIKTIIAPTVSQLFDFPKSTVIIYGKPTLPLGQLSVWPVSHVNVYVFVRRPNRFRINIKFCRHCVDIREPQTWATYVHTRWMIQIYNVYVCVKYCHIPVQYVSHWRFELLSRHTPHRSHPQTLSDNCDQASLNTLSTLGNIAYHRFIIRSCYDRLSQTRLSSAQCDGPCTGSCSHGTSQLRFVASPFVNVMDITGC